MTHVEEHVVVTDVQLVPADPPEERELTVDQLRPSLPLQIHQDPSAALDQDVSLAATAGARPLYNVGQSVDISQQHSPLPLDILLQHVQQPTHHRAVRLHGILRKSIFSRSCLKKGLSAKLSSPWTITTNSYLCA